MPVIVAAAIVRDGKVLAAQRSYPPEYDGQWELPGGKVDPGESESTALQRECDEELGITVSVGERVGEDLPTAVAGGVLRVYACTLDAGEPTAREHRALAWIGSDDLEALRWLDADRPLLPALRTLLRGT